MKLILQIVIGIVIGGLLLLAITAAPGWIAKNRETNANIRLNTLSPESVIAKCGKPIEDKIESVTAKSSIREMSYAISPSLPWAIRFSSTDGSPYYFIGIHFENQNSTTAEQQVRWSGCLDK